MEERYFEGADAVLNDIQNGRAFLIVKKDDKVNIMQIGWGFIGFMWNHPHLIVAVRPVRYTYQMIKDADEFVVSIPKKGEMKEELKLCGTASGSEVDKAEVCKFEMIDSSLISVPRIGGCRVSYECKITYRDHLDPEGLDAHINRGTYPQEDHHLLLMGRIVEIHMEE